MDDEIKKPSFLVYYDNEVVVLRLPDKEAGKLFKSLFPYGREEIKPDFEKNPALAMAFDILSMAIDRDKDIERDSNINYQQIADMYNEICISFPRLTKLSDSRKKAIRARLNQYAIEDFKRLFTMAEESSFLKGQNNRDWSANFDWLIKDSNMAKVLDGNYMDRKGGGEVGAVNKSRGSAADFYEQFLGAGNGD